MANILGLNLHTLRERAGLTQAVVADRTDIGISSLSDFENGKREPSIAQAQALAACFQVTLGELLDDNPIAAPDTVLWRERPVEQAPQIAAEFLKLCRQYHNLETWCRVGASVKLNFLERREPLTYGDAEALARDTRKQLCLGERPARTLLSALEEDCGVKVFHMAFEPTGTAACARGTFGVGILLNSKNVRWRRNFDLAHELFHVLAWQCFERDGGTSSEREEKLANAFASCLLLPDEAVRSAIHQRLRDGRLAVAALLEIARDFDVSVDALLWRIKALYNRSDDDTRRTIARVRALEKTHETGSPQDAPSRPARYASLAVTALCRGELSVGRFAEYMGISRREAQDYVEQEDGSDEALELPAA